MMINNFLFYLFSSIVILSAIGVVTARQTVYSVLFLIFAFFNAAGLFLLAGAELLAMILVIVYVGAVAVLFLFVVMMLNTYIEDISQRLKRYAVLGGIVGGILGFELVFLGWNWVTAPKASDIISFPMSDFKTTNAHALGELLYTHCFLVFQISGLILLVAMIGAIVLTLRHQENVKRQSVGQQLKRSARDTLELHDVSFRKGVKL
ncbi:MAG: NADH-quinone oxidoreductase subunit J [Proteobacteria bacterium]|nr:NADH-quinone oxidoreductase subunit J [Pseudomonadota bacterium]